MMRRIFLFLLFCLFAIPGWAQSTFGAGSLTGADTAGNSNSSDLCRTGVPASSGTVTSMTWALAANAPGSTSFIANIYSDVSGSPSALLAQASPVTISTSANVTASISLAVISGTTYWVCVKGSNTNWLIAGLTTGGAGAIDFSTSYPTLNDPYVVSVQPSNVAYFIQATYTPTASGKNQVAGGQVF